MDRFAIGLVLVLGAALLAFGWLLRDLAPAPPPDVGEGATILPVPQPLPEFALRDHEGAAFDRSRLEGRWTLLFFGYASCPDVCPIILQELGRVAAVARESEPAADLPQVVFVSVDPDRDSTDRLREYVTFFDDDFVGVSGDTAALEALARGVGAYYERRAPEGGGSYLVDHSTTLFLVDPQARFFAVLDDPHDPHEFVALLARVLPLGDTG